MGPWFEFLSARFTNRQVDALWGQGTNYKLQATS